MRALLVDDEPAAIKGLESLLNLFCPDIKIIGVANSVNEALNQINLLAPELIFLDIEMKDGNGFDVLERTQNQNFSTIFVTAFDQYAIKALRMHAMDYLLKPIDPDELVAAIERVIKHGAPDYKPLIESNTTKTFKKIGVPGSRGTTYIELDTICRLESSNNYTYIYCGETKPILISRTIKSFEELLPEGQFIRCHQRHIVNLDKVHAFERNDGAHLLMKDGAQIPISRANRSLVDKLLIARFPSL